MSWGAVIGAGASILGGVLSSKSSSKGAEAQVDASAESIAFQRESRDMVLDLQKPYRDASYRATAALMDLTGLSRGGIKSAPKDPVSAAPEFDWDGYIRDGRGPFETMARMAERGRSEQTPAMETAVATDAPDLADYPSYSFKQDPGYQFRMDEGMKALERGAAARGGLLSGGFARKALRYAQDYASNEYTNVYNRVASIAGFGQTATNNSSNAIMVAGGNVGNAMMNAGEARASGYVGQGNAWANAINQIGQIDWESAFGKGG